MKEEDATIHILIIQARPDDRVSIRKMLLSVLERRYRFTAATVNEHQPSIAKRAQ
jgi:hypothetical protein